MCTHSHTVVALFSLLHVYTQSYSCNTILSPFTQPYNLKTCCFCYFFHTSFHSHSHIFLIFFLIHTISLLHFFLTFYTIIDILFCSIYSLKHFFMQHSATCHLSFSIKYTISFNSFLSIHKTKQQITKHQENINIKAKYCLN